MHKQRPITRVQVLLLLASAALTAAVITAHSLCGCSVISCHQECEAAPPTNRALDRMLEHGIRAKP